MVGRNSIEAQSPRDPISSGGEDDGDEEEPWSARDVDLLHSLVRTYGKPRLLPPRRTRVWVRLLPFGNSVRCSGNGKSPMPHDCLSDVCSYSVDLTQALM